MFCEHAMDYEPADLVRDERGRVCCPRCIRNCETCGKLEYKHSMRKQGMYYVCEDCLEQGNR